MTAGQARIRQGAARSPIRALIVRLGVAAALGGWLTTSDAAAQVPCSYDVTVLPNISCFGTAPGTPVAINNLGHVLLSVTQCAEPQYNDARLWTGGTTTMLVPRPPGYLGFTPTDLNDNGYIVGYGERADGGRTGAIYESVAGVWTIIPPLNPPAGWSRVNAINNRNETCGNRSIGGPKGASQPTTAFIWSHAGGITDLGLIDGQSTAAVDIADDGGMTVILGVGISGYLWHNGIVSALPTQAGADSTAAGSITVGERMAGGSLFIDGNQFWGVPLRFEHTTMSLLPLPGAPNTNCVTLDINSSGLILGRCKPVSQTNHEWRPHVWLGDAVISVNSLLPASAGFDLRWGAAINDVGQIVCDARTAQNTNVVVVLTPRTHIPGDITCDSAVNLEDLVAVIGDWGQQYSPADVNHDLIVDVGDLIYVIVYWTG